MKIEETKNLIDAAVKAHEYKHDGVPEAILLHPRRYEAFLRAPEARATPREKGHHREYKGIPVFICDDLVHVEEVKLIGNKENSETRFTVSTVRNKLMPILSLIAIAEGDKDIDKDLILKLSKESVNFLCEEAKF